MLSEIFRFELRRQLLSVSTYVYFAAFFGLGVIFTLAAGGALPGASVQGLGTGGKVLLNSPYMLYAAMTGMSYYGLLVIAAVVGYSGCQDFLHNSYPLIFTTRLSKWHYLFGRYLASCLTLTFIFSGLALGIWLTTYLPNLDRQMLGPNRFESYAAPYWLIIIPNTLFTSALFLAVALFARKMMPVYVLSVVVFVGYAAAAILASDLDNKVLISLIDPFGNFAAESITKYWSVSEKNTRTIPFEGWLLANRLIWLGIGFCSLIATGVLFQFKQGNLSSRKLQLDTKPAPARSSLPRVAVSRPRPLPTIVRLSLFELRQAVSGYGFWLIMSCAVLLALLGANYMDLMFGTPVYPVTAVILELISGQFSLFVLIVTTVHSGEMVWRERDLRMNQITDTLPLPTWVPYLSKIVALILLQIVMLCVVLVCGIGVQIYKGYYHFEAGLYLEELFGLWLPYYALLAVLSIVVQSVVHHKYLGHLVIVGYYLFMMFSSLLGAEHGLFHYAAPPQFKYSDMNGFGNYLPSIMWFDVYRASIAVLLLILGSLMWVRGLDVAWRQRFTAARKRMTASVGVLSLAALLMAVGSAGYIYYNTVILNGFVISSTGERRAAEYEQIYKSRMNIPQPHVMSARIEVDLEPEKSAMRARGEYQLKNLSDQPISTVFLNLQREAIVKRLSIGSSTAAKFDYEHEVQELELPEPLPPGQLQVLEFDLEYRPRGFKDGGPDNRFAANGTFVDSSYFPMIGYVADNELGDEAKRRKRGLTPKDRMPAIDDQKNLNRNYITADADWTTFEATVSTSSDQIAVAPGTLVREWTADGRKYFQYKSEVPVLHFFSLLSARYRVKRDQWNDVAIEIYYHPGHEFNLDAMMEGAKYSLEYCSTHFGPYQHKVLRILEFPRYRQMAQAFSNTVPFSESIGFIAHVDPKNEKDIDYPVYVTAHEVAHQWWAHQVVGANVQGATLLSETLAQYSALMVMKHRLGPTQIRRFLKYELDRYLSGRSDERHGERPLSLGENQGYIHYNKGSLVMYALQDYFGEDTVNRAIASFLAETKFQGPPYPTSRDLIRHFREVAPPDGGKLVDELFEAITLYELKANKATFTPVDDGKYEVRISVKSRKITADEFGVETDISATSPIDIGVLNKEGKYLYLQKHAIDAGESEIVVVVDGPPSKAGIDPLNILVDREPDDNLVTAQAAR